MSHVLPFCFSLQVLLLLWRVVCHGGALTPLLPCALHPDGERLSSASPPWRQADRTWNFTLLPLNTFLFPFLSVLFFASSSPSSLLIRPFSSPLSPAPCPSFFLEPEFSVSMVICLLFTRPHLPLASSHCPVYSIPVEQHSALKPPTLSLLCLSDSTSPYPLKTHEKEKHCSHSVSRNRTDLLVLKKPAI